VLFGGTTLAAAGENNNPQNEPKDNWGQEVNDANQNDGYGVGVSRGEYVREQARDDDGPGYGGEIHDLANPGKSDPQSDNFQ
jgi:hypothetical protein